VPRSEARSIARYLEALGLPADVASRRFASLSTGERQRVLVAAAAAGDAEAWVADEPTSALDTASAAAVVRLLRAFAASGRPVLVASHDPAVHAAADRCVLVGGADVSVQRPEAAPGAAVERLSWALVSVAGRLATCSGSAFSGLNALTGTSGSGKSTLLRVLAGLLEPDGGTVTWEGGPWRPAGTNAAGGRRVQLVFATPSRTLRPDRTVRTLVEQVATAHGVPFPGEDAWHALGLTPDVAEATAATLSGGMAARVALLRALSAQPDVLLLDEPTAALDDDAVARVLKVLTGPTGPSVVLAATHDPRWVAACVGHVSLPSGG
jgi:peptide/nickel transport system ATP-binding protein